VSFTLKQSESQAPGVPERAIQGVETGGLNWSWVEASVWNERMLAALENGVKGGKWFSLIDDHQCWPTTFFAAQGLFTLKAAWRLASQSR
jgi:hypothetical protein